VEFRIEGLVAAVPTPMNEDGEVSLDVVPQLVQWLLDQAVDGLFVCGSTGEGMSLSVDERRAVAEAFVSAASGRVPVVVHVGHNSLREAAELARHAQLIGACAIAAIAPCYYPMQSVATLVQCVAEVAGAAPDLPFYYYHIPELTNIRLDMIDFLRCAAESIPNLVGMKYSAATLDEYQLCCQLGSGRFDVLWGTDEMLLPALCVGCRGAVGSTYNISAGLYHKIVAAFKAGRLDEAECCQRRAAELVRVLCRYGAVPALKAVIRRLGIDCGPCRLPLRRLSCSEEQKLFSELDRLGLFEWSQAAGASAV